MGVHFKKHESRYCRMFERTLNLWEKYNEEYRTILKDYERLLAKKRELNIKPLNKIKESSLREFPIINFLYIDNESKAEEYLLNLTERRLCELMGDIDLYVDSKLRRDLRAKIFDYRYEIRNRFIPKSQYAMSPEACGRGRKASNSTILYSDDK